MSAARLRSAAESMGGVLGEKGAAAIDRKTEAADGRSVMRWRRLRPGRGTPLDLLQLRAESRDMPFEAFDLFPLGNDSRVEILDCVVLFGSAHFQRIDAGGKARDVFRHGCPSPGSPLTPSAAASGSTRARSQMRRQG